MLTRINHWQLHYDLLGEKEHPAVILVHALMADGSFWSDQVPPLLKAGYRVLRVDLPGHGGSGVRPGPWTMVDLADDIALLLDQLRITRVHFAGISFGGMLGQTLVLRHPERVASLFLSDTTCAAPSTARDMWAARTTLVTEAGSVAPLADPTMDRVLTPAFKLSHPETWAALHSTIIGVQPAGLVQCAQALQDFNVVDQLPDIRVPTLVACGDGDVATPPIEAQRIAALIPGARYQEIPRALHYPNVEQSAVFNQLLVGWLESQRGWR